MNKRTNSPDCFRNLLQPLVVLTAGILFMGVQFLPMAVPTIAPQQMLDPSLFESVEAISEASKGDETPAWAKRLDVLYHGGRMIAISS